MTDVALRDLSTKPINISILEMRKPRYREVKEIAPVHKAIKWQRMMRTLARAALEHVPLPLMLYYLF